MEEQKDSERDCAMTGEKREIERRDQEGRWDTGRILPEVRLCDGLATRDHDDDVEGGKNDRNDENSSCETAVQEEG